MVLTKLAINKPGAPENVKPPSIVMAHPASSTARVCAEAIARAWNSAGIKTSLRPLNVGETYPPDNQWDILYAETFIEEPLIDAVRLFGENGLTNDVTACLALRNIHRQVSVDLSVIPLYQVKEHFAFRDNVSDIGRDLVHLYQNVDRWTIETIAMAQRRKEKQNQR